MSFTLFEFVFTRKYGVFIFNLLMIHFFNGYAAKSLFSIAKVDGHKSLNLFWIKIL